MFAGADDGGGKADAAGGATATPRPLGELLSPLVLEPDGTLVPVHYGFDRRFALGNVKETAFRTCADRWRRELDGDFRALCREELAELLDGDDDELPVSNWYERLGRRAASLRGTAAVGATRRPRCNGRGRLIAPEALAGLWACYLHRR